MEENLYGTDITTADTDGDGITDFDETQTGWTVPAIGPAKAYQVYPSPLAADLDGDFSADAQESARKTDPNLPDTNDDGLLDGQQGLPAALAFCPGCYRAPDFAVEIGTGSGSGTGQFGDEGPGPLGVNRVTGDVYVADRSNHRVLKFDTDGKFQLAFGSEGNLPGQFGEITGVAADGQGNVYVGSLYASTPGVPEPGGRQGQLQKFTANGTHVASVSVIPWAVTVDRTGMVYADLQTDPNPDETLIIQYTPTFGEGAEYIRGLCGARHLRGRHPVGRPVERVGRLAGCRPALSGRRRL